MHEFSLSMKYFSIIFKLRMKKIKTKRIGVALVLYKRYSFTNAGEAEGNVELYSGNEKGDVSVQKYGFLSKIEIQCEKSNLMTIITQYLLLIKHHCHKNHCAKNYFLDYKQRDG